MLTNPVANLQNVLFKNFMRSFQYTVIHRKHHGTPYNAVEKLTATYLDTAREYLKTAIQKQMSDTHLLRQEFQGENLFL